MKIRISDKEFYIIELDKDEISPEEFSGFMNRLKIVEKILSKSELGAGVSVSHKAKVIQHRGKKEYPWKNDKAELIKAFKIFYNGTKEEKERYANKVGDKWNHLVKNLFYQRREGKIKPKDLGMKYFPSLRGKEVNIKQAKIKDDDHE